MFEGHNQDFYPFTVVEITDPKYRDNIGFMEMRIVQSMKDINQLVKRINDPS